MGLSAARPIHKYFLRLLMVSLLLSALLATTLQATLAQTPPPPGTSSPVMMTATALAVEQELSNLVLFSSLEDNEWVPYLINADGTGKRLLNETLLSMTVYEAVLSPNRKYVALEAGIPDTDRIGIYLATTDGSQLSLVLEDEDTQLYITWLSDSQHIGFTSRREEGTNIYVTNLDGSQITRVTPNDGSRYFHPLWSPDGTKIAFMAANSDDMTDLYVMNADGSDVQQLTDRKTPYGMSDYSWSPDSRFLAFTSQPDGFADWNIYTLDVKENVIDQLTYRGENRNPLWSPDGTKIAFTADTRNDYSAQLYTMKANGLQRTVLTGYGVKAFCTQWMPDSERLVFIDVASDDESRDIYTINADETGLFKVMENDTRLALSGCIGSFG